MRSESANIPVRSKKFIPVILWVLLTCGTLTTIGYLLLHRPAYLVLPIKSPSSYLPQGDWLSTAYSTYEFPGSQDRYYVWRQEAYVRTRESDLHSPFATSQSLWNYFDNWLTAQGWVVYESSYGGLCSTYMPETNFLSPGRDGYLTYRQQGVKSFSPTPTTCLAIWRFSETSSAGRYHIALVTVNPSIPTVWNKQFDLGWK